MIALAALTWPGGVAGEVAPAAACSGSGYRQFDFWIGDWSVVDATTRQPVGASRIELLYGGCALRENWTSLGFSGGSLNAFWKADGKWRQTWVDQSGALRQFVGGLDAEGRMVLVAVEPQRDGASMLVRMTFTPNPDQMVRQFSDYSTDGGRTWRFRYDFLYGPVATASRGDS